MPPPPLLLRLQQVHQAAVELPHMDAHPHPHTYTFASAATLTHRWLVQTHRFAHLDLQALIPWLILFVLTAFTFLFTLVCGASNGKWKMAKRCLFAQLTAASTHTYTRAILRACRSFTFSTFPLAARRHRRNKVASHFYADTQCAL